VRDTPRAETPGLPEKAIKAIHLQNRATTSVLLDCAEIRELEDGYELGYPANDEWDEALEAFCTSWRVKNPALSLEVHPDTVGTTLWLRIRGPDGTKQFVEGARYIARSHINPRDGPGRKLRHGLQYLTSPLRVLPDYLILGAKKAGTTALYDYVTQHPQVTPAFRKEISFFNGYHGRGQLWYRSLFPTVFGQRIKILKHGGPVLTGEATPDYLWRADCAGRVKALIPKVKLIAILRNPVDRAFSHYNHNRRFGFEERSFEDAVDAEAERLETERLQAPDAHRQVHFMHHSYKARGAYVDQLVRWFEVFPREQFLVLKAEDLKQEPEQALRRVFGFLDLPYHAPTEFRKLNSAVYETMDPPVRRKLEEHFAPHNERLAELLGTNLMW